MKVFVPLAPDLVLNSDMLNSLAMQTIKYQVESVVAGEPGKALSWQEKIENICIARNACLDLMQGYDIIHDNDCIMLRPDNIEIMRKELDYDPKIAAVALKAMDREDHARCGCIMFAPIFFSLRLRYSFDGKCECRKMQEDIIKAGYQVKQLEGIRIKNTQKHVWK